MSPAPTSTSPLTPRRALAHAAAAALVLTGVLGTRASAAVQGDAVPERAGELGTTIAAFGRDTELSFDELDELLIWRYAMAEQGRSALRELIELRTLGALARERGIEVSPAQLQRKWDELERELRAGGAADSLDDYLIENRVDKATFRDYLSLAIVHERLTREALHLAEDAPVTGEQQSMWLEGVINERGYTEEAVPFAAGVVAQTGDVTITRDELEAQIRQTLSDDVLSEACFQLLLQKRVLKRMPDLSTEAIEGAVDAEIARRRAEAESNPEYKGISYEQLLSAQGLSLEAVRRDPAIRVAALSTFWLHRTHSPQDLRDAYEADRAFYEGLFGEGVEVQALVLKAARFKNELNPRTFEEADAELIELRERITTSEDFTRLAQKHSEDMVTRETGGRLGVVTRAAPRVPSPIRDAVFARLDTVREDVQGQLVGPVRIQGASALLCLGRRRRAPAWEEMREFVKRELRRRFLDEQLLAQEVVLWFQ